MVYYFIYFVDRVDVTVFVGTMHLVLHECVHDFTVVTTFTWWCLTNPCQLNVLVGFHYNTAGQYFLHVLYNAYMYFR